MAHAAKPAADDSSEEQSRVAELLSARLSSRGVSVHSQDSADDLGTITEAVERFEAAVESLGGDLMVDEPPSGQKAEPDNAAFVLPARSANETAHTFVSRIESATAQLRAHS